MLRQQALFRLHLTLYIKTVLPACPAGRAAGMRDGVVVGTALGVTGRAHPVDAVFQGPPDAV